MDRRNDDIRNEPTGSDRDENRSLYRLNELDDYKVASDDPDVRGWAIVDRDNHQFGTIKELIVDPEREKVRYLDVVPGGSESASNNQEDHLLIPIGVARIDHDRDRVLVSDIDKELLSTYPTHSGDTISRDYEFLVVERFNNMASTERNVDRSRSDNPDFYDNHVYDENRFYTNRSRPL